MLCVHFVLTYIFVGIAGVITRLISLLQDPLWLGFAVTDDLSAPNWTEDIPELEEKVNVQSALPSLDFTGFSEIDAQR